MADGFSWHHRTIEHVEEWGTGKDKQTDTYLTVHEFCHERRNKKGDPLYMGFSASPESPRSKQEALWMAEAFDHPPAVRVYDKDMCTDEHGFPDFKKFKWLVPHARKTKW